VLAGPGLGDQPVAAGPFSEQGLPETVVDLVRAAVEQVLALEVDLGVVALAQIPCVVQRRRPAGELLEQAAQLGLELVGVRNVVVRRGELLERFLQRVGDVSSAVAFRCSVGHVS